MARNNGYKHYAGMFGTKNLYVGSDPDIYMYTDIASALSDAKTGDVIYLEPGTYTQTATLDIDVPGITMVGLGAEPVKITSALATRTVMINVPAVWASAITMKFKNIAFENSSTGDCVEIDNDGGATVDLTLNFEDCNFYTAAGVGIDLDQTENSKDIFLKVKGKNTLNLLSASTFDFTKAGSSAVIYGMNCLGAFALSTTDVAYLFFMIGCVYYSQAQTVDGAASAIEECVGNYYGASGYAAAITKGIADDFDATAAAENIILFA